MNYAIFRLKVALKYSAGKIKLPQPSQEEHHTVSTLNIFIHPQASSIFKYTLTQSQRLFQVQNTQQPPTNMHPHTQ